MYDNEEEIKRKRRNLLIIIGIVVLLIILLLIFLVTRGSGKKKPDASKQISCELEIKNAQPGSDGAYHQSVEVGFKSINLISNEPEYAIQKSTVGTTDNSRNKDTYTTQGSGNYTLHGYIQDKSGNKGTCDISFEVRLSNPTCELEVVKGTKGSNGWYKSDVVVGFKSMDANSETASIVKYYIEKEIVDMDTSKSLRADPPANNIEKYTVKDNQSTTLIGYVIDSNGIEGTCRIVVSKDTDKPKCTLKVTNGKPNSNGIYTNEPVIAFNTVKDATSDIVGKGIGVKENYNTETYTVTKAGTTIVYGYVKDEAGNKGTCSTKIVRPSGGGGGGTTPTPTPPTPPTPTPTPAKPTCSLKITEGKSSSANKYVGKVTVALTKNNATQYGIGTAKEINSKTTYSVANAGTYTVYGTVKNSAGDVAYCSLKFTIVNGNYLAKTAKVGEYVAYEPGNWSTTVSCNTSAAPTGTCATEGYSFGYTKGKSKSTGVLCFYQDVKNKKTAISGWRVLSVSNDEVTLVSAGTPECMYHSKNSSGSEFINKMKERAKQYSSKYSKSVTMLDCSKATGSSDCTSALKNESIMKIGTHYFLASVKSGNTIWGVSGLSNLSGYSDKAFGLRPVVILKSTVLTTSGSGKQNDPYKISIAE